MTRRWLTLFAIVAALVLSLTIVVTGREVPIVSPSLSAKKTLPDRQDHRAVGDSDAACTLRLVSNRSQVTPTWESGGPIGASVQAITYDPAVSGTVYIATAGGGLYRSTDDGETWDDTPNEPDQGLELGAGHHWVKDVVASTDVVYAATHGQTWFHWSHDHGLTWSHASGGPGWAADLALHPTISTTLYAAGSNGVYTTTDGGQSWSFTSAGMAADEWITEIALDPTDPTTVYAASGHGRVYKSTDGGAHWTNSSAGLPGDIVWSVAVNPVTPTIVYAGLEAQGVWRSTNGGATWSSWSGHEINCPYVREIVIDPSDSESVYVGTDGCGVYRRSERDAAWTYLGPHYTTGQRRVYAIGMTDSAPDTLLIGVWGDGIYKSANGGHSWQERNVDLSALRIERVAVDPSQSGVVYASGRGGLFRSSDAGESWNRIRSTRSSTPLYADVLALEVDDQTGRAYIGMYNGSLIASTDGLHWQSADSGLPSSCHVFDIAVNNVTPTTIYAAMRWGPTAHMGVYRSVDSGAHWVRASSGLTDTDTTAVTVDPSQPEVVYAGTPRGNVFRSTDGGATWSWSGSGVVVKSEWATIWDFVPDPKAPGVVYLVQSNEGVSGQGGVYKSTDYGATWDRCFEGHDPRALVISPMNNHLLTVASWNDGLYRSKDGGITWSPYDVDGFPGSAFVRSLDIGRTPGGWALYAGTGTNSIWQKEILPAHTIRLPLIQRQYSTAVDTDGDGLTDDEECVKYKTDPLDADSDGDGTPDDDWEERREYVYTVRVLLKIRQPFDLAAMNDWFQDVRILSGPDPDGYTQLEAILYPELDVPYTPSSFPPSDLPSEMDAYTQPGIATNYDAAMQAEIDKIVEEAETDEEAVSQILQWVADETTFYFEQSIPEVYYTYLDGGEVKVRNYSGPLPVDELLRTHYFADTMFDARTHGTCTSVATLKCAMVKAAGIPCRVLQTLHPIYYHGDQAEPYENKLTRTWECNYEQPAGSGATWCNHAFLEVFLGGQWVRADRTINIWHQNPECLNLKIVSVADWSEVDFSQTWPTNWIHNRPYYTTLLEDQEPEH